MVAKVKKMSKHCRTKRFWWVVADGEGEKNDKGQERDYLLADKLREGGSGGGGGEQLRGGARKKARSGSP